MTANPHTLRALRDRVAGLVTRLEVDADDLRTYARDGLIGIHPDQDEFRQWAALMEEAATELASLCEGEALETRGAPSGTGSQASPGAASVSASGFDPSREQEEIASPFRQVLSKAYGWAIDDDGYLWGLTAGDMGYEKTDMKAADLLAEAERADWDRFCATGIKSWPTHDATLHFVGTLAKSSAQVIAAPRGGDNSVGSVEDKSTVAESDAPSTPTPPEALKERAP